MSGLLIPPGWQLVPIKPNHDMTAAFGFEIRIQAGKLDPSSTAHEPLAPLWASVLAAAPEPPPLAAVPRDAAAAWNAGIYALSRVAQAGADALRARLVERPTRFNHAVAALDAIVEAAAALIIPPDDPEGTTGVVQPWSPTPSLSDAEVA